LERQSKGLLHFAKEAKSFRPLDPSIKPILEGRPEEKNGKWMLAINVNVEIDI